MKLPNWVTPKIVLAAILLVSFGLMLWSSLRETATFDEVAHIPAGYSYVKFLDYRLNPEHPPLVKVLAGLPLLFQNFNFPTQDSSWSTEVNGQWRSGALFLYESGNNPSKILGWSRLGPILLTLILIFFVYFWSRKLIGNWWALLPTSLLAFSPNVLAHGHYVTTDIGAALGITASTYFFLRFLEKKDWKNILLAGITLGLAELAKFSAVLLLPFFVLVALIHFFIHRNDSFFRQVLKYAGSGLLVFLVAYALVVYPVYAVLVSNFPIEKQAETTWNVLKDFDGGPTPEGKICKPKRCMAELSFFLNKYEITRPAGYYLFGLTMVVQRASGGNNNYFLGQNSSHGSPFYFPFIYALKEPLGALLLFFLSLLMAIRFLANGIANPRNIWARARDWGKLYFSELTMLLFVLFYWYNSVSSPLNIGYRHLMPIIPFTYILVSVSIKNLRFVRLRKVVVGLAIILLLLETVFSAPHFLSFYNAAAGGPENGYRYATDSNYDWGQDLNYLKDFLDEHPEINKIAVDYFGGGSPRYTLGDKFEDWWSARGNPKNEGIEWIAISANTIQGAMQYSIPELNRKFLDEYRWLEEIKPRDPGLGGIPKPDYRAGESIFIYKL